MNRPLRLRPLCLSLCAPFALLSALLAPGEGPAAPKKSLATITVEDMKAWELALAGPELEGRDTPSLGLERAAAFVAARLREAGCQPLGTGEGDAAYLWSYQRILPKAEVADCKLELLAGDAPPESFVLFEDFVPIPGVEGAAEGPLVFIGFGINAVKEHWEDIKGKELRGAVVLVLQGEPASAKLFDGPEISREADLWEKLGDLKDAGAAGAIFVRRPTKAPAAPKTQVAAPVAADPIGMRSTWASWNGEPGAPGIDDLPKGLPPSLEVTAACASKLLGEDVEALAVKIEKSGRSLKKKPADRKVRFGSRTSRTDVALNNVVAKIPGSDPALAEEVLVIGAHYDHIGVDPRGRIGYGADDNASGTAGLIEVAQALAAEPPRRTVLLCAFSGEEDGLLGSQALCARPPVPPERMVAMINMDMIGRGEPTEVAVLGIVQNPDLEKVLDRARRLAPTGIKEITVKKGEELFARSDHHSFHKIGVPVLFFFEGLPIDKNKDYHTWRDTLDKLDYEKMARTARLVFNTAWILANDDSRPPKPRESH